MQTLPIKDGIWKDYEETPEAPARSFHILPIPHTFFPKSPALTQSFCWRLHGISGGKAPHHFRSANIRLTTLSFQTPSMLRKSLRCLAIWVMERKNVKTKRNIRHLSSFMFIYHHLSPFIIIYPSFIIMYHHLSIIYPSSIIACPFLLHA